LVLAIDPIVTAREKRSHYTFVIANCSASGTDRGYVLALGDHGHLDKYTLLPLEDRTWGLDEIALHEQLRLLESVEGRIV
jgi:hypothetical protein